MGMPQCACTGLVDRPGETTLGGRARPIGCIRPKPDTKSYRGTPRDEQQGGRRVTLIQRQHGTRRRATAERINGILQTDQLRSGQAVVVESRERSRRRGPLRRAPTGFLLAPGGAGSWLSPGTKRTARAMKRQRTATRPSSAMPRIPLQEARPPLRQPPRKRSNHVHASPASIPACPSWLLIPVSVTGCYPAAIQASSVVWMGSRTTGRSESALNTIASWGGGGFAGCPNPAGWISAWRPMAAYRPSGE
jgi:hypothetical protein